MDVLRAEIVEAVRVAASAAAEAAESKAEIVTHERVCAERYGRIDDKLLDLSNKLRDLGNNQRNAFIGAFVLAITIIGALITILLRINAIPA